VWLSGLVAFGAVLVSPIFGVLVARGSWLVARGSMFSHSLLLIIYNISVDVLHRQEAESINKIDPRNYYTQYT